MAGKPLDLERMRASYIKHAASVLPVDQWSEVDINFLAEDANTTSEHVQEIAAGLGAGGATSTGRN